MQANVTMHVHVYLYIDIYIYIYICRFRVVFMEVAGFVIDVARTVHPAGGGGAKNLSLLLHETSDSEKPQDMHFFEVRHLVLTLGG